VTSMRSNQIVNSQSWYCPTYKQLLNLWIAFETNENPFLSLVHARTLLALDSPSHWPLLKCSSAAKVSTFVL
jgi:hypothetical protein